MIVIWRSAGAGGQAKEVAARLLFPNILGDSISYIVSNNAMSVRFNFAEGEVERAVLDEPHNFGKGFAIRMATHASRVSNVASEACQAGKAVCENVNRDTLSVAPGAPGP